MTDGEFSSFGSTKEDPFIPAGEEPVLGARAVGTPPRRGRETKVPSYSAVAGKVQLYAVRKRLSKGSRILEVGSVIPDGFLSAEATEKLLEVGALALAPKGAVAFYVYKAAGGHDRP